MKSGKTALLLHKAGTMVGKSHSFRNVRVKEVPLRYRIKVVDEQHENKQSNFVVFQKNSSFSLKNEQGSRLFFPFIAV